MGFTTMFIFATIAELFECVKAGEFETISSIVAFDGVYKLLKR